MYKAARVFQHPVKGSSYTRLLTSGKCPNHRQPAATVSPLSRCYAPDSVPSHTTDLEVTQVRPVLLLCLPGELVREELHWGHCRNEVIDVVLCEVTTAD